LKAINKVKKKKIKMKVIKEQIDDFSIHLNEKQKKLSNLTLNFKQKNGVPNQQLSSRSLIFYKWVFYLIEKLNN